MGLCYTTSKNYFLKKSDYYKSSLDIYRLKKFYESKLGKTGNKELDTLLEMRLSEMVDNFNFSLNNFLPSDKISNLIIPIINKCNLNCKGCTSFSPLGDGSLLDTSIIEKDLKRLSDVGFQIREISIEGGEPFLHPNILDIVQKCRDTYPNSIIVILTNGTLLNNFDITFYSELKKLNCQIIIDSYFEHNDFSSIESIFKSIDLHYEINNCYSPDGYFFKYTIRPYTDTPTFKEIADNFSLCEKANRCITLLNGKVYTCGPAAYIGTLNKYFNLSYPDCGIDIYINSMEKISELLSFPCKMCGYCKGIEFTNSNYSVSSKSITEWV